jgi:hypothetical protein
MSIRLGLLLAMLIFFGCATGNGPGSSGDKDGQADAPQAQPDTALFDSSSSFEATFDRSSASDLPLLDSRSKDISLKPDGSSCIDPFKSNTTCALSANLGSVWEGDGWASVSATLVSGTDIDWFAAYGIEQSHSCFPLDLQCYIFKLEVTVPAGRKFQACLYQSDCSVTPSCKSNVVASSQTLLDIEYQVDGICGIDDSSQAYILVSSLGSASGCSTYQVKYRFDACPSP